MSNPRPVTVDEAEIEAVRPKRSGRQRGASIYYPEAMWRKVRVDPSDERVRTKRYAALERRKRADGTEIIRGRFITTFSIVGPTRDDGGREEGSS